MTDKEKIRAEIERLKKCSESAKIEWIHTGYDQNAFAEDCRIASFNKLLFFIDSMQEEPNDDWKYSIAEKLGISREEYDKIDHNKDYETIYKELKIMSKYSDFPYPLTIIADRYTGCYSGGKFTAWPLYNDDIPEEPCGDDYTAMKFWEKYKYPVGIGDTLQEAYEDLLPKVDKWQEENSIKSQKRK